MKWLTLLIPTFCGAFYHLGQKKLRGDLSPFILFSIIYFISMALMLFAGFFSGEKLGASVKSLSLYDWRNIGFISLGIIGIELGFLLVYRKGLPLNTSALLVNCMMGIMLLLFGVLVEQEKMSPTQLVGVVLAILGTALITFRG